MPSIYYDPIGRERIRFDSADGDPRESGDVSPSAPAKSYPSIHVCSRAILLLPTFPACPYNSDSASWPRAIIYHPPPPSEAPLYDPIFFANVFNPRRPNSDRQPRIQLRIGNEKPSPVRYKDRSRRWYQARRGDRRGNALLRGGPVPERRQVGGRPPLLPPLRPRRHQGAPRRRYVR